MSYRNSNSRRGIEPESDDSDGEISAAELIGRYRQICMQRDALEDRLLKEQLKTAQLEELEETIEILKNDLEASEIELNKFRKRYLEAKSVVESYVERNSRLKEELRLKEVEDSEQNLNLKKQIEELKKKLEEKEAQKSTLQRQLKELQLSVLQRGKSGGDGKSGAVEEDNISHSGEGIRKLQTSASEQNLSGVNQKLREKEEKVEELEKQVAKLKEDLLSEQRRSAEEAEELTQEMAELRFELTDQLEEEKKRRASTEALSVERVRQLELQLSDLRAELGEARAQVAEREDLLKVKEEQLTKLSEDARRRAGIMKSRFDQEAKRVNDRLLLAEERARRAEAKLRELGVDLTS